jgi:hypothetical protein
VGELIKIARENEFHGVQSPNSNSLEIGKIFQNRLSKHIFFLSPQVVSKRDMSLHIKFEIQICRTERGPP